MASVWAPTFGVSYDSLYDPELNVALARRIYDIQGWGAWSPTTSKGGELGALGIEASAEVRYTGWPVYTYDGTNAKTILKAMRLEEGDSIITTDDGGVILMRASAMEELKLSPIYYGTKEKRP
jgi:hypothetical protein